MDYDFKFFFNRKKQFCEVYLWNVHPNTFSNWGGGRWGYFMPTWENPRLGKFGELHFVRNRLRFDTVSHEIFHLHTEWVWSGGEVVTRKNEEKYATIFDEITRRFIRELRKVEPRIKL
jgi:hypothetical protein